MRGFAVTGTRLSKNSRIERDRAAQNPVQGTVWSKTGPGWLAAGTAHGPQGVPRDGMR